MKNESNKSNEKNKFAVLCEWLMPLTTFTNWWVFKNKICCFFLKLLSDQDFMKVSHCNFSSVKHDFRDNEVFCKPDMTSSWFGRQGVLHAIFHDRFGKSDHNFLIPFHRNFFSGMHGFWDNKDYYKPDMTLSQFLRLGALQMLIQDAFWKSEHDLLIVIQSNFLFVMHGFRDYEVLLQAGYDVIVISRLGALPVNFHDAIWKSDHDFLIVFIVTFYLWCMVSKITRFYCKPDMTSSWFIR